MNIDNPVSTGIVSDRSATTAWELERDENDGLPIVLLAHLVTSHQASRKCFFSTLRALVDRTEEHQGRQYHVQSYWVFDFVRVGDNLPCPRYSEKALRSAHEIALGGLEGMALRDDAEVAKVFGAVLADQPA